MGGAAKLHVGFPEKAIDKYLPMIVSQGYKVAIIEQTETPAQLEARKKAATPAQRKSDPDSYKCVNRDIS